MDHAPQPPYLQDGPSYWSIDYIRAPREVVFDHLTTGEHTKRYYYGMPINDPREVGQAVWFGPTEEASPIRGKVLAYDRPSRFSHTFAFGHRDDAPSVVDFVLDQAGPAITKLTLHHHGFDGRTGTYIDVAEGWPAILASLKSLLETGEPLDWPQPEGNDV